MMTHSAQIRNLEASRTKIAERSAYLAASFVENQFGTSARSLDFGKAGSGTILFNFPVMFWGEYPLGFAQRSTDCFTQIAPSNIPAIAFLREPLTVFQPHRSIAIIGRDLCIRAPEERPLMSLRDFISKQWIDVIEWVEPEEGILAYRYPMQDREIQNGGKLTVRESQLAVFVNEGRVADAFGPGLYTLTTQTLPILTYIMNWDKAFKSPFKSDVYFFSARIQTDQHWGTQNPITIRDKEFGAIRLRGFGIYSYHLSDAKTFYTKISGTRDLYRVADLEGQLRNTIIAKMTDAFAASQVPFLDMAANQGALAEKISETLKPSFTEYGLTLDSFVVENLSLPDELQKVLDQRISMNVLGDMGKFTQYQVAQAIPVAAANEGGGAVGIGAGLGAGVAMGQAMMDAVKKSTQSSGGGSAAPAAAGGAPAADTKFCSECGKPIARSAKFCPECGKPQA
jgi:membrane protease subunit (stomatin/prohibitin family)